MYFDFFLWPMLIPLILPIIYCIIYKKNRLGEIITITLAMVLIVIFYWPLSLELYSDANLYAKFILFVILPLVLLFTYDWIHRFTSKSDEKIFDWKKLGLSNIGLEKSLILGFILLPLMIFTSFIVSYNPGFYSEGTSFIIGSIYFVESFTEEFFFRGVLFLFLSKRIDIRIAYITSLFSFILMHPQQFTSLFIIATIVQGILTIEIVRRSENLLGAWVLHGFNRFFILVIFPFIL